MSQVGASGKVRTGVPVGRRRLLIALALVLVALFVVVELLLLRSYGETERTTREFQRTTDAATANANAQRESLLLAVAVSRLRTGDRLMPITMRRGLLERQLDVVQNAAPADRDLAARVRRIRAGLARFDAAFVAAYGDGARARPGPGRARAQSLLRQLDRDVKASFDEQEHALYGALRETLDQRANDQLLIVGLSAFALLMAAVLAVVLGRAIRGGFAKAYGMLDRSEARLQRLVGQLPAVMYALVVDDDGRATPVYVSPQSETIMGVKPEDWTDGGERLLPHIADEDRVRVEAAVAEAASGGTPEPFEFRFRRPDGEEIWLRENSASVTDGPDGRQMQGLLFDVTAAKRAEAERDRMEVELRLAQKLEAVGQLAAGIAHEINTPVQFVGDTVRFLEEAFSDLLALQDVLDELKRAAATGSVPAELLVRVGEAEELADLDYLRERVPAAFERAGDGIRRVGVIVGAMREFAHPPTADQAPVDLNAALGNTLIVAANEYKYVADVETDLGDLPAVVCNGGDINQVFLNLIVNAGHAIADQVGDSGERGRIRVQTRRDAQHVLISIADTGCGIPAEVAGRVFDPFFTTKEVGRGTGQGLAIARTLVVERHAGTLTFESEPGRGTTFHVRLPIAGERAPTEPIAA